MWTGDLFKGSGNSMETQNKVWVNRNHIQLKDFAMVNVAIEFEVIAVQSVVKVLDGKAYKRAILFHKLMYKTCLRFTPKGFLWVAKRN